MKKLTLSTIAVALLVLITMVATSTIPVAASSCASGYLVYTGDYDFWRLTVKPGHWYTISLVGPWYADFDLYIPGMCSRTGPGSIESCSFLAKENKYIIKVESARTGGLYNLCVH